MEEEKIGALFILTIIILGSFSLIMMIMLLKNQSDDEKPIKFKKLRSDNCVDITYELDYKTREILKKLSIELNRCESDIASEALREYLNSIKNKDNSLRE